MAEAGLGTVSISPQVLATIARFTTLDTTGVVRMYRDAAGGFDRWLHGKGGRDGVHIEIVDSAVSIDLYIVAAQDMSLYELSHEVQAHVTRAIKDMVGMPVLAVNVHIEEVAAPLPAE